MIDTEKELILRNNIKLRKVGLLPRYIDCNRKEESFPKKLLKKVPFSSIHNTYQDYEKDLFHILDYCGEEIPDDLVEKVYKTQVELGLDKLK